MAGLIDFLAVVHTPLEIALARRTIRNLELQSPVRIENATREELIRQVPEIRGYLKYFMNLDIEIEREVYLKLMEQVEPDADLILDEMLPMEKLADELIRAVKEKRHALE